MAQQNGRKRSESSTSSSSATAVSPSPPGDGKSAPDGCSVGSSNIHTAAVGQPSPPSSDSRGEVEGSSDNNSPPTSVIQGSGDESGGKQQQLSNGGGGGSSSAKTAIADWLRGPSKGLSSRQQLQKHLKASNDLVGLLGGDSPDYATVGDFHSLEEEVLFLRSLRAGDGNSSSSSGSGRQCDAMSDSGLVQANSSSRNGHSMPYETLLNELTHAKRQLLELHSLVSILSFSLRTFSFETKHRQ